MEIITKEMAEPMAIPKTAEGTIKNGVATVRRFITWAEEPKVLAVSDTGETLYIGAAFVALYAALDSTLPDGAQVQCQLKFVKRREGVQRWVAFEN